MDYKVGDEIVYETFLGNRRRVLVTDREDDIKNGRPGFDGVQVGGSEAGEEVWGYDDQIVNVTRRHIQN
jgi:hypothetical protein